MFVVLVFMALMLGLFSVCAQWMTQELELQPGWNAVYLEVQPMPGWCDSVFSNTAVDSVWKWNRRFTSIQFEADPANPIVNQPHWQVWFPSDNPNQVVSSLAQLEGAKAYLIHLQSNAALCSLSIKGRVILPQTQWYPHSLNLAGLPVAANAPTFADYFEYSAEIDVAQGSLNELYNVDSQGQAQTIVQPARVAPQAGRSYWVKCERSPSAYSPMFVQPASYDALDFGALATEDELTIRNMLSNQTMQISLSQIDSEDPPVGADIPGLSGPVPLALRIESDSGEWVWINFPANGITRTLAPGAELVLRFGVRRSEMSSTVAGNEYQSILEVKEERMGLVTRVPVRAEPAVQTRAATTLTSTNGAAPHYVSQGLWLGDVVLAGVNAPAYTGTNILATPSPCRIRLILFVDSYQRVQLLQQVLLVWDTTLNSPPHTDGAYALYSDPSSLPDGAADVYRISSSSFPRMVPLPLSGTFTNELSGMFTISNTDPTNPYFHRYHPMHDNKNWDFEPYTNAVEVPDIVRNIHLAFADPSTNSPYDPFWGQDLVAGTYTETIEGLRSQPICTYGVFALQRISTVGEMDD